MEEGGYMSKWTNLLVHKKAVDVLKVIQKQLRNKTGLKFTLTFILEGAIAFCVLTCKKEWLKYLNSLVRDKVLSRIIRAKDSEFERKKKEIDKGFASMK